MHSQSLARDIRKHNALHTLVEDKNYCIGIHILVSYTFESLTVGFPIGFANWLAKKKNITNIL